MAEPRSLIAECSAQAGSLKAIEFGCGVGLAGLAAHALGYDTTLTDCLPGHLKNLAAHTAKLRTKFPKSAPLRVRFLDWISDVGAHLSCSVDLGSPENVASSASSDWERLEKEQLNSFDLALASDVVYEEHHAVLLPKVMQRWLKPGGCWAVSLAIRDADMSCRFLEQLDAHGLVPSTAEHMIIETACRSDRCSYCSVREAWPVDAPPLDRLRSIVRGHEGGAILVMSQRPA